eukprot:s3012_g12.t1
MLDDHSGDIGPWTNVNVLAVSVTGCELKKTLLCLLVDLRAQKFASLSAEAPVDSGLEFLSFGTVRVQSLSLGNWLRGGARRPRTPFRVSSAAAAEVQRTSHACLESGGWQPASSSSTSSRLTRRRVLRVRERPAKELPERPGAEGHVSPLPGDGAAWEFPALSYFSFVLEEMWEAAERGQAAHMMSLLAFGAGFRRTSSPRTGFCLRLAAPSSSPGSGLRHAFRPKLVDGAAGLLEGRRYDRTAKIHLATHCSRSAPERQETTEEAAA